MFDYSTDTLGAVLGGFLVAGILLGLIFGAVGLFVRSR